MTILLFIFVVCSVSYALLGFAKAKYIFNPCTILNIIFGISVPVGSVGFYGTDIPKPYTVFLILLAQTCFTVSYLVGLKTKISNRFIVQRENVEINMSPIYMITAITFVYTFAKFWTSITMLKSGLTTAELRWAYFSSNGVVKNPLDDFLDTGLINGFRIALMMIAIIETYFKKNLNVKDVCFDIVVIAIVIMRVFINSGRLFIYDAIFALIIGYAYKRYLYRNTFQKKFKLNPWKKIVLALGGTCIVYIMVDFTLKRQIGQSILESLYDIFTCFVQLLDKTIQVVSDTGDITYGVTSFDGIFIIINMGLSFLGLPQNSAVNIINKYDAPFWNIGGGKEANAYLSYIFSFYLDFRVIGVVIGACVFGFFAARIFNKAVRIPNKYNLSCYLMLMFVICRCSIRWALGKADFFVALILLSFIYRKKQNLM